MGSSKGGRLGIRAAPAAALAVAAVLALGTAVPWPSAAQDRVNLARVLGGNLDFRVRVQAAFALGASGDPAALDPLVRALSDPNPAIRAAAVMAIGRLGRPEGLHALDRMAQDPAAAVRMQVERTRRALQAAVPEHRSPSVATSAPFVVAVPPVNAEVGPIPWAAVRYVLFVGSLENRSGYDGFSIAESLRREVDSNLRGVQTLAVLQSSAPIADRDRQEMTRRRLPRLRIDGVVNRMARQLVSRQMSIRCEVSFVLFEEPERVMRGMLSGAATGSGELLAISAQDVEEHRLAERALRGAVRSALADAAGAIARAARH